MKKKDLFNGFTAFAAIACLLAFTLNMINGRFHLGDFKVYYTATQNFISGEQVYLVSFYSDCGFYKYSPATLFFFLPYMFFSFKSASIIHFFILGAAYWYTFIIISKIIKNLFVENIKHEIWLITFSFGCILIHFARELYLGNINIILLLLCSLSVLNLLKGKNMQGGILLGIAILAKPFLLILLLPLVLRKKRNALAWLFLALVCGFILPFIFPGPVKGAGLYVDWIKSMLTHVEAFPGMTSLDYFIRNLFPSWPAWGMLAIFFSFCVMATIFILNNLHREKQKGTLAGFADMNFTFEWFLMIALLPNLIKTDWVLMIFCAPLITFMIFYIATRKKYGWIPLLVILLFFYGLNSDDLLGKDISHTIMMSGLMGLGNFLLVMASLFMFLDLRKKTERV